MKSLLLSLLFTTATAAQEPAATDVASTFSWADYDGDGRLDVLVLQRGRAGRLLHNEGAGRFQDVTHVAGLQGLLHEAFQAAWADFDGDGRLDVFLPSFAGESRLLRQTHAGSFAIQEGSGLPSLLQAIDARWVTLDTGRGPDLFLSDLRGERRFLNQGGRFVEGMPLVDPAARSASRPALQAGTPTLELDQARAERGFVSLENPHLSLEPASFTQGTLGPLGPLGPRQELSAGCAFTLRDTATNQCIGASSVPTLGMLMPLNAFFNVTPAGLVGIGTTTPAATLDVVGSVRMQALELTTAPFDGAVLTSDAGGHATWQTPPQGPQGDPGPAGPQGLQGDAGPAGPQGPQGDTGPAGPQGLQGDTGPAGPQGLQGDAGPAGPQGLQGDVGPAGPQGPQGDTGPAGPQGLQGDTGPAGPQGLQGDAGPAGPQGLQGDTGPAGPQGPQGDTGPAGPQGPQGDTGPAGPQGLQGDTGSTGPQGLQGDTGPAGPQGLQGDAGPAGPQGLQGDTGPAGPQGPQGDPGPAGPQGATGVSPYRLFVDPLTGSPTGPVVFDAIQPALDAAALVPPAVVVVAAGTYVESLVLPDGVSLRGTSEMLTHSTILDGSLSYAGTGEASVVGFYVPTASVAGALVQHTGSGLLRLFQCALQNTAAFPAVVVSGGGSLEASDCVVRSDGGTGSLAAVHVTDGTFLGFRTNVIGNAAVFPAEVPDVSALVEGAAVLELYGPATVVGQVDVAGATATARLSNLSIDGGTMPAVRSASSSLVTLSILGLNTNASVAVDNGATSPVAYSKLGYGGTGVGFTNGPTTGMAMALLEEGADNLRYDNARATVAPLTATTVQAALDELADRGTSAAAARRSIALLQARLEARDAELGELRARQSALEEELRVLQLSLSRLSGRSSGTTGAAAPPR